MAVEAALEILKVDPVKNSLKQLIVAATNFKALSWLLKVLLAVDMFRRTWVTAWK